MAEILMAIILICVFGYALLIAYLYFKQKRQEKIWNNGIAPSGEYWKWYNTDEKGRRYYIDENGNSICRISFTDVDNGLIYKNLL